MTKAQKGGGAGGGAGGGVRESEFGAAEIVTGGEGVCVCGGGNSCGGG